MPRKPPHGCYPPKMDAESYRLMLTDLRFMRAQMENVWNMLCYYSNMRQNKSGELVYPSGERIKGEYEKLCELAQDILTALEDVEEVTP